MTGGETVNQEERMGDYFYKLHNDTLERGSKGRIHRGITERHPDPGKSQLVQADGPRYE